jgi:hypothetical protein
MRLFEEIARKANEIAQIGDKVRAEAQATGTPVCYTEPASGTDVIVEYPDGHRERLTACGSAVTIAPRGR